MGVKQAFIITPRLFSIFLTVMLHLNTNKLPVGVELSYQMDGPDALWDYRTKQPDYTRYIGATSPALEGTSDLDYLLRPSSHNPTVPAHRHCYAGEIGWGVKEFSHLGKRNLLSGMQITNGLFRQAAEDKSTHRYQTPCNCQQQNQSNSALHTCS
ncbi:uncharacterized protein C4orf45 homolog isoform X2 [Alligator mississippiensis]|uniref:uncharacterized protein C4orf45 homolog isoform X2 n=1 Tax=Alligator mississippiensis TaxID=8496 RepID=UPI002878001C|nr:uncharacterized protein C4orf45 homolog isoform X2 [Alligator mississippiensis]